MLLKIFRARKSLYLLFHAIKHGKLVLAEPFDDLSSLRLIGVYYKKY